VFVFIEPKKQPANVAQVVQTMVEIYNPCCFYYCVSAISRIMDWTKYTTDPCDEHTEQSIRDHLKNIRIIAQQDYMSWLLARIRNKNCLDIGAIEHDLSHTEKPSWKHKQISGVASRVVGVDILEEFAQTLNERGYDIRVCDATSDAYLGEKFDTVILGDVIEHVENPVNLLRFAVRHMNDGGEVIVKTPNPYYIDNIVKFARNRDSVNFEHIAWYTPTMALELARRAQCRLVSYVVFSRKRPWKNMFPGSDIFTRDFVYIYSH
jgi:2-polyprenyl-3-methyl-5-hydroxy-6-metoxy-1,4-benzoquinol methylase